MRVIFISLIAIAISGCASVTEQNPIVDPKVSNMANYDSDLYECRVLATQVNAGESATETAVVGAFFGSAIGAVIGAFEGGSGFGESVAGGAATGAISGGVKGSLEAYEKKKSIVGKCLEGRGYQVLSN
jgi:outer membrane lipoprotein SlyB